MGRIDRKYLAHYIRAMLPEQEPVLERLGKGLEEYTVEMNAQVESRRDITGCTDVSISGYDKSGTVEYFCEQGSVLFHVLQTIIDQGLTHDQLKAHVIEVKLWEGPVIENNYNAIQEDAYIEVTSYGGDTAGYRIGFTIHYTGVRTPGFFNIGLMAFSEDEPIT